MPVRIFQLARELGMASKDLIAFLHTQGHRPTSHMSNVDDTVANILRDRLKPKLQRERAEKERLAAERARASGAGGPAALAEGPSRQRGRLGREPIRGSPVAVREREARPSAEAPKWRTGAPGRHEAPAKPEWEEKAAPEKEGKERPKEGPRLRRFFPSQEDLYDSGPRFGSLRRKPGSKSKKTKSSAATAGATAVVERPQHLDVQLPITVRELSALTGIRAQNIITTLWKQGRTVTINQSLDEDMVLAVALEHGIDVSFKKAREVDFEETLKEIDRFASRPEDLVPRAPVVTFLGHVDHGKTSLLDKIRETSVTAKEAGGITQHIGAYRVDKDNVHVVFIDTPGHEAFTEMRARGANVTDVAVLVVAADDGVMPQTEEAISHARAAKVPIVVAINKIDKPNANPMRCKQQLAALGLQPVEWGGDTEFVEVSALTSQGIDNLLVTLTLTAEMLELKANPKRPAVGVALEAKSTPNMGVVATFLVQDGTLRVGDAVLCGASCGRVRGIWLNGETRITEAGPATPVTVTGLHSLPEAGDRFYVLESLERAKEIAEERARRKMGRPKAPDVRTWDTARVPEVRIILKTDVQGTLEALSSALSQLPTDEVKLKILHKQVGGINQADVMLADAFGALIVGFNVGPDEQARNLAQEKRVEIRRYDVIYKLLDDVRAALAGKLAPETVEEFHGRAEIRKVIPASKIGNIAGCYVSEGFVSRTDQVRVRRNGQVIHSGAIASLKRFKDDVKEVRAGFECGLKIAGFEDIQEGDMIEAFALVEKPRQL